MIDVALLGVAAEMRGVVETDRALKVLGETAMKTEGAIGRFSAASIAASQSNMKSWQGAHVPVVNYSNAIRNARAPTAAFGNEMKISGMHTANVFAQLNDIFMMMASGQSPMMLAMQQGTQLNQVWGQMGGKVGMVGSLIKGAFMQLLNPLNLVTIGVIAGGAALYQYFTGAGAGVKTFKENLDELETAINNLNDVTNMYSDDGLAKLKEKYGSLNAQVLELIENQKILALDESARKLQATLASIGSELGDGMLNTSYGEIGRVFETSWKDAQILYGVIEGIGELDSLEKQKFVIQNLTDQLSIATNGFSKMTGEQSAMFNSLVKANALIMEVEQSTRKAENAAIDLSNASPGSGWMASATSETNMLIGRLMAAKNITDQIRSATSAGSLEYGKIQNRGESGPDAAQRGAIGAMPNLIGTLSGVSGTGSTGSSGASGGGSDPYQSNLDRLMSSLMTERETVEKWYADNEVILNDRRAMELLGEAGHKDAMLDLERQYHDKLRGIKDASDQFSLDSTASLFGNLNSLAGGGYSGLLTAQRSFAAASALISTYKGAADELARPTATPWQKFSAVAKVIATGMGFVKAIKSGGSASGGGGGASGPGAAAQAPVEPIRTTVVNFQGDPFMVAIAKSVTSQMYEASGNGRVLIKQ